ncbi:MAG: hypothetical protein C4345_07040 [Chloroflexota bacterium]
MVKQVKRLLDGIAPTHTQVASIQAVHQRALIAVVGDETYPDLGDRYRQCIMQCADPVACLDLAGKQQAAVNTRQGLDGGAVDPGRGRRAGAAEDLREEFRAYARSHAIFELDCFLDHLLQPLIERGQVLTRRPSSQVECVFQRLAKGRLIRLRGNLFDQHWTACRARRHRPLGLKRHGTCLLLSVRVRKTCCKLGC